MTRTVLLVLLVCLALACGGGGGGGGGLPNLPPSNPAPDPEPEPDPDPDPGPPPPPRPEFIEEIVYDKTVSLSGFPGVSSWVNIDVPADTISMTIEGYTPGRTVGIGIQDLIGPDNRIYVYDRYQGDYTYRQESEIFSTTVPNTDVADLGLFAGSYRFRLYVQSFSADDVGVRVILERRAGAVNELGQLPLNVWLASGLSVDARSAPNDQRLQDVLDEVFRLLNQSGVEIIRGDIDYYDIDDPKFDNISSGELDDLCEISAAADKPRLNVFFVEVVFGDGVVGASATISGPKKNGTRNSGVAVDYTGVSGFRDTATIGGIAAHEIGHFLGLYHTVESDGEHDIIEDTPDCPATGTNSECSTRGGGLLMHWEYRSAELLTPGQGLVLRSHPIGGSDD